MPRLFTGLEIPEAISQELSGLRGGLPGARWIEPGDYHITLRFIGDIDVTTANEIAHELATIAPRDIDVTIEELAAFGSDKPHALIARARGGEALVALQAEHERLMRRLGVPPDARKFAPHVTLARMRGASASAVADFIQMHGGLRPMTFRPARFVLYSARESKGGGPYRVEVDYPL